MNIYKQLNECISYIEDNISSEIDYKHISKIFGYNISTIQKVFSLITGMTLTEYIRRRRLTVAISDIKNNGRIIDIALKYGYASDVSFSRSFKRMHGVLPSKVKNNSVTCNMQPMLKFNESKNTNNLSFRIENINKFTLYGIKQECDITNVPIVAGKLWKYAKEIYPEFKTEERYGIVFLDDKKYYYSCALREKLDGFESIEIPKSKWIIFKCDSFKGTSIKELFDTAIDNYLPDIGFNFTGKFELEKYYDNYTELYIMIN